MRCPLEHTNTVRPHTHVTLSKEQHVEKVNEGHDSNPDHDRNRRDPKDVHPKKTENEKAGNLLRERSLNLECSLVGAVHTDEKRCIARTIEESGIL